MANAENLQRDDALIPGGGQVAPAEALRTPARHGRSRSIRRLGAQLLRTPVDVSDEQREALTRLGIAEDESELQILLLGRLATIALYGDPRLALQAVDRLLEIAGKDIRTLENDENRKIKLAELALNREKFEASARSPEQPALEKLDALIAGIDALALATAPALPEEDGAPTGT